MRFGDAVELSQICVCVGSKVVIKVHVQIGQRVSVQLC